MVESRTNHPMDHSPLPPASLAFFNILLLTISSLLLAGLSPKIGSIKEDDMDENHYAPPQSDISMDEPPAGRRSEALITPRISEALARTKPWVRFLSILGFISCGFLVLVALFVMLAGDAGLFSEMGLAGGIAGVAIGAIYLVYALLYAVAAYFMYRYADKIRDLLSGGGTQALEEALEFQKSFWRFVGILTLVFLIIGFLAIGAAILIPLLTVLSG